MTHLQLKSTCLVWVKKCYKTILLGSLMVLFSATQGCSDRSIHQYEMETPMFNVKEYFNGQSKAYGMVQNWRGKVIKRFVVDLDGSFNDKEGVLKEYFVYSDGQKQTREWRFTFQDENRFTGEADDVVGKATGEQYGNAIYLQYRLKVPVDNKIVEFDFDDRLYRIDDKVVLNKAKMKKFGVTVANLTISFVK